MSRIALVFHSSLSLFPPPPFFFHARLHLKVDLHLLRILVTRHIVINRESEVYTSRCLSEEYDPNHTIILLILFFRWIL